MKKIIFKVVKAVVISFLILVSIYTGFICFQLLKVVCLSKLTALLKVIIGAFMVLFSLGAIFLFLELSRKIIKRF